MTDDSAPDAGVEDSDPADQSDRRASLTKMLVGTAFAVPAVSSFTMGTAGAGTVATSPWKVYGGATIESGHAVLPYAGGVTQSTVRTLAAGAAAVFQFTADLDVVGGYSASVYWTLRIPADGSGFVDGGSATTGVNTYNIPTQPGGNAGVEFINLGSFGSVAHLDDVSLQEEAG